MWGNCGWLRKAAAAVALLSCLVMPADATLSPAVNWDMVAYIGIIKSWSLPDPVQYQAATYADLRARFPGYYKPLVAASDYTRQVESDPAVFAAQLPFYRVRPLYLLIVRAVAALTSTVAGALGVVSVLAALAINLLVAGVSLSRLGAWCGSGVTVTLALSPLMINMSQLKTPDSLFALFVACGILLLADRKDWAGAAVLVVATAVRSEAMLLNLCLAMCLGAEAVLRTGNARRWVPVALGAGSLALGLTIAHWAGAYSYTVLYHFTFSGFVADPASLADVPLSLPVMAWNVAKGAWASLADGSLWALLLETVLLGAVLSQFRGRARDRLTALAIGLWLYTAARFLVFPASYIRFNAPALIGLVILLACAGGLAQPALRRLPSA